MKKNKSITKSGPQRLTWVYYKILSNIVREILKENDDEAIRQKCVMSVFMSVNLVETFINVYFRILAEDIKDQNVKAQFLKEIEINGLDWKMKNWPVFKKVNLSQGIGQEFIKLKDLRNDLMHYKPTYETLKTLDGEIRGLTDTTVYDDLNKDVALKSIGIVEGFIGEIMLASGVEKDKVKHALHGWIGKVPA